MLFEISELILALYNIWRHSQHYFHLAQTTDELNGCPRGEHSQHQSHEDDLTDYSTTSSRLGRLRRCSYETSPTRTTLTYTTDDLLSLSRKAS